MNSRTEQKEVRSKQATDTAQGKPAVSPARPRHVATRCGQRIHRRLHDEVVKQVAESAEQIVQATLDKAKAGSLAHTKWLFSLMEGHAVKASSTKPTAHASVAQILLESLQKEH